MKEYVCKPFDYTKINKNVFIKEITELYKINSKKFRTKTVIKKFDPPLKLLLVLSKDVELNRPPCIVIKGRRVGNISDVEHFNSLNLQAIWKRGNLTGYCDATGVLELTPTRKDFMKTELSKAFFNALVVTEEEILKYIEKETASNVTRIMRKFESSVIDVLKTFLSKKISPGSAVDQQVINEYKFKGYGVYNSANNIVSPKSSKSSKGASTGTGKSRGPRLRNKLITIKYPIEELTEYNSLNDLDFRIEAQGQPVMDRKGNKLRSVKRGSVITVFKKHPDFQERLSNNSKGQFIMNERISYYLAMEITTHLYNELQAASGDHSENTLSDFATSVYELEKELKSLVGKKF